MHSKDTKITIASHAEKRIESTLLKDLYASEPWWPERGLEDMEFILGHNYAIGAWAGDGLVGFARAVTDGRFRAYIEDVLVLEEYRRQGIGTDLVNELLSELGGIHVVTLFCQPKLSAYYTSLGFKEFSRQVVMHLRNVR